MAGPMQSTAAGVSAQLAQHLNPASASQKLIGKGAIAAQYTPTPTPPRPVGDPSTVRPQTYGRGGLTPQQILAQHAARLAAFAPPPPAPYVPGGSNVVVGNGEQPPITNPTPPPIGAPPPAPSGTPDEYMYQNLWRSSPQYLALHPQLIANANDAAAKSGYIVHIDPATGLPTTGTTAEVASRETDPSSQYWANVDSLARNIQNTQRSANSRGLLFSGSNAGTVGMANTAYQGQQATNIANLRQALQGIIGQENSAFQLAKPGLVANAPVQGGTK